MDIVLHLLTTLLLPLPLTINKKGPTLPEHWQRMMVTETTLVEPR